MSRTDRILKRIADAQQDSAYDSMAYTSVMGYALQMDQMDTVHRRLEAQARAAAKRENPDFEDPEEGEDVGGSNFIYNSIIADENVMRDLVRGGVKDPDDAKPPPRPTRPARPQRPGRRDLWPLLLAASTILILGAIGLGTWTIVNAISSVESADSRYTWGFLEEPPSDTTGTPRQ